MQSRTLKTILTILGLALGGSLAAAPAEADCPYDLLAMCCTQTKNGKCTRWQNCCDFVWKPAQEEGSSSTPAGSLAQRPRGGDPTVEAVAEATCVRRCNGTSRETAGREACYGGCAVTPDDARWATVHHSPRAQAIGTRAVAPRGIGGVATPTGPAGNAPSMKQLGSTLAKVPMEHGSCGLDCATHVLAQNGNLGVKFELEMSCPAGTDVVHLSYQPAGHNTTVVVGAPSGAGQYSQTITAQPFTAAELEAACQQALGGSWPIPGGHGNTSATVQKGVHKSIEVWGQCSGWANKVKRTWPVALSLTCEDRSFFVPEG